MTFCAELVCHSLSLLQACRIPFAGCPAKSASNRQQILPQAHQFEYLPHPRDCTSSKKFTVDKSSNRSQLGVHHQKLPATPIAKMSRSADRTDANGARVASKKVVEMMKEATGASEEDICTMLQLCNGDANEATEKLLESKLFQMLSLVFAQAGVR